MFEFFARALADEPQGLAAFADDDAFLAGAFDEDSGVNVHQAFAFLVLIDDDAEDVGDFLVQVAEDFFADDFRRHEAHPRCGDVVFGVDPRLFGQERDERFFEIGEVLFVQGGDGDDGLPVAAFMDAGEFGHQRAFVAQAVDFVEDLQYGFALFLQGLGDAVVFVRPVSRFADVQDEVNVVHALPSGAVHVAVDGFAAVLVDAGGIDEDELVVAAAVDAKQGMPRGLRFAAGDGDFLAEEVVDEGGFADIGAADDGDVSGALGHGYSPFFTRSHSSLKISWANSTISLTFSLKVGFRYFKFILVYIDIIILILLKIINTVNKHRARFIQKTD